MKKRILFGLQMKIGDNLDGVCIMNRTPRKLPNSSVLVGYSLEKIKYFCYNLDIFVAYVDNWYIPNSFVMHLTIIFSYLDSKHKRQICRQFYESVSTVGMMAY